MLCLVIKRVEVEECRKRLVMNIEKKPLDNADTHGVGAYRSKGDSGSWSDLITRVHFVT